MSYKVALIQNESELLRYSHADVRPILQKYEYESTYYTSENIKDLFDNFERYDAIILATNACNDEIILNTLVENKQKIADFLDNPYKGLLINFQMALTHESFEWYPFLPDRTFGVKGHYRFAHGEKAIDGKLSLDENLINHVVLTHPNHIDVNALQNHCLTNKNTPGLYWGYLTPLTNNWDVLIKDETYDDERGLFLVSRLDGKARVIISSLVLDWQLHELFLENALRYVVEGQHFVGVIVKYGNISFDIEYLKSVLTVKKIAFDLYSQRSVDFNDIPLNIHKILIFDPLFAGDEIQKGLKDMELLVSEMPSIFYFQPWVNDEVVLSVVNRIADFDVLARKSILWMKSLFENKFWEGSFWRSVDVLGTLYFFGEDLSPYRKAILQEIAKKRTTAGTYDNVFGATCAMLLVYHWFGETNSKEFNTTLEWILLNLPAMDVFNRATGIEVLLIAAPETVSEMEKQSLRTDIFSRLNETANQLELLRFSSVLSEMGFTEDALSVAKRLSEVMSQTKDMNIYSLAEITFVLISILRKSKKPHRKVRDILFNNVQLLQENFDNENSNWGGSVITTAKALKTLKAFTDMIKFPVDDLITFITDYQEKDRCDLAISVADSAHINLQQKYNELEDEHEKAVKRLKVAEDDIRFAHIWIVVLLPIVYLLSLYIFTTLDIFKAIIKFMEQWQDLFSAVVITLFFGVPVSGYLYLLARYGIIRGWIVELLEKFFHVPIE